jgi:CheY-like chemotaxis protein
LARRLLELHGGTVRASSAGPGRGSEFTIRLPTTGAAGAARDQKPGGREEPLHARILIAEDNQDAAEMLATLLTGRGCEVSAVHDGQSAVREAERVRPDVLLLDIGLPLLDGYDACRQIRRQAWSAGLKIIALTGWGQEEDRRRATMAGFDRHLVKPVDPERLVAVLRDVLSH